MSTKRKAESNSRATNKPRIMKSGGLRADSERDSGFSDASSEHMSTMDTTDSEDSSCPAVQQGPRTFGQGSKPSQVAVVGSSYSNLSPMIIMNNVLIKQPGEKRPALKPWGFSPSVEVVQPVVQQPQVVFLQPVVSRQASSASKEACSKHRRPKSYLPILKSYTKIAPYPGDSSSSSGRGTGSSSSSSSSASEKGSSSTSNQRDHCHREKQQRNLSGGASTPGSTASASSVAASPTTMSPQLQSRLSFHTSEAGSSCSPARERPSECTISPSLTHTTGSKTEASSVPQVVTQHENSSLGEHNHSSSDSDADTKRKRFCNTYNILSQSGLLDIALRTKELHRLNKRTQNDLEQLKKHTDLFLQALWSGDSTICVKLQACLQEEDREKDGDRVTQTSSKSD
ncbi:CLOCK-interacting pacemaker [Antennarius striatus]|uniref:CLOCK-interacting pacemaker n=1 Tax=Antennarius striatus TaxID=241820 RepID=UPI0035B4E10E